MIEAATSYLRAGLCVLPAIRAQKRPAVGSWKQYQKRLPTEAELPAWMARNPDAVCILCGEVSGNAELLDFDGGGELFSAWWDRIPEQLRSRLVIESSQSGGWHVIYRCQSKICGNLKLAQRKVDAKVITLIETRGEGGLFLCAPTAGYSVVQGDMAEPPVLTADERDVLLQAAWDLNEYLPPVVDGPPLSANVGQTSGLSDGQREIPAENSDNGKSLPTSADNARPSSPVGFDEAGRPGDDFNIRGDVRDVLRNAGWTLTKGGENEYWRRPGKSSGWSATLRDRVLYVFSSNAAPFEPNRAYSPFCVYAMLACGGDFEQAARSLRQLGFGNDCASDNPAGVDISGIVSRMSDYASDDADNRRGSSDIADPGPIPEDLFAVPGFVARVMDFTMANAPYPNLGLAFCGAMALQSFLAGRKVRTPGDLRTNIYLLALASSGTGKDFPRKVNSRVLFEIGLINAVGDKFASGEGIQDALARTSAMLFQNDEMDGVLRQINLDRENKRESIPNILLTLYTSANDVYPLRAKAGQKQAVHIDQPHLTLFGTATPQYFYESLSQRMLANGFFARLMIVDVGRRNAGQAPGSARDLPEPILEIARWWADFQPGERRGNLFAVNPEPRIVEFAPDAADAIAQLQRMAEAEYDKAQEAGDEVARTAWSRTCENAKKLALIYACSENYEQPIISLPAVQWATAFAMHQTRRQLYMAATYVAENPFHAECLKFLRKLRDSGGQMARREMMRVMRCKAQDFDQIVTTLIQQGDVQTVDIPTKTRPAQGYQAL